MATHEASGAKLTRSERMVLIALAHHENGKTRRCIPGVERLRAEAGVSKSTVLRSLAKLERVGLIAIEHGPHRKGWPSNSYTLAVPATFREVERKALPPGPEPRKLRKLGQPDPNGWMNRSTSKSSLRERYGLRSLDQPEESTEERDRRLQEMWAKEDEEKARAKAERDRLVREGAERYQASASLWHAENAPGRIPPPAPARELHSQ